MRATRRTFLKTAGAAGVAALAGGLLERRAAAAEPAAGGPDAPVSEVTARGLSLCSILRGGKLTLGVRTPQGVLDVERAAAARGLHVPLTPDEVLAGRNLDGLRTVLAGTGKKAFLLQEGEFTFGPCVTAPQKIIMMGFNFRKHCNELKIPIPTTPVFFNKFNNALLGHGGTIRLPTGVAKNFDYEVELVVVVGKTARDVLPINALAHVAGYCTGNDFTARDLQFKTTQFMIGKTCDGFAPIGPWLVGADLVGDPQKLKLECRVNGEVRQSSNTDDMIFSCADLVSYASSIMTLQPGDIIFTGTPEGVIQGKPESRRVWLKAGDKLSTEIEKLGELRFSLA
jgi:2-keto-4-pentenoate hydratase/2-oxohepta-3-ene-1,7-dioic acid hydratase in catechol pathway